MVLTAEHASQPGRFLSQSEDSFHHPLANHNAASPVKGEYLYKLFQYMYYYYGMTSKIFNSCFFHIYLKIVIHSKRQLVSKYE